MGANMARRLRDRGFTISAVYDVRRETAEALAGELNTEAPNRLSRVTELSDAIVTVVSDDRAMDRIFALEGDSLLARAKGKLFLNCATVSPEIQIDVARRARKAKAQALEACMASSIPQAREGTLYLMCGGAPETFEAAKPILEAMGQNPRYIGKAGSAAQVKALVNMVMNINTAGLAEGLALGEALGLDLTMLREVFAQTGANSNVLRTDGEDMQNREHSCYFSAAHAAKDSGIALQLAKAKGLALPLAKATHRQYRRMQTLGLGDLDKSGVAELTFQGRGPRPEKKRGQ